MAKRFHIIIDLNQAKTKALANVAGLEDFLQELPGLIGMSILYGPIVKEGIPENPGLSGFVIIDYSHISVHTFTQDNSCLVDIFSCKPYDQEHARDVVLEYFGANKNNSRIQVVAWD